MQKDFEIPRLEMVRDVFIFSCFCGLAYIDVAHLTQENIITLDTRLWLIINRQKTNVPSNIPLLEICLLYTSLQRVKDAGQLAVKSVERKETSQEPPLLYDLATCLLYTSAC